MHDYALIFRRTPSVPPAALPTRNAAREWALALGERGLLRSAAPLEDEGRVVSSRGVEPVSNTASVASVLVIRGESLEAATSLAQGHPALASGTEIEIRPVKPVGALASSSNENVYFVDRFSVPRSSIDEFTAQVGRTKGFVATLPGYLRGEDFERIDEEGNLTLVTIAVWKSRAHLDEAKRAVRAEFERIGFNPAEFFGRLNIRMVREEYRGSTR